MANYCVSVKLAVCCCNCNYLQRVCKIENRIIHGRVYGFCWSDYYGTALLFCNGVCIGEVRHGALGIYPQFKSLIPSVSMLLSLMSYFNLFPY